MKANYNNDLTVKHRKLFITLLITISLLTSLVSISWYSFAETNSASGDNLKKEKLQVVTTIFPQYDFLRKIAGDKIDLSLMLKPGVESHNYEPSPKELVKIIDSDLLVYVGGQVDKWVESILETRDEDKLSLSLVNMVETLEEELIEGMEHEHDHHDNEDEEDKPDTDDKHKADEHEEDGYDEHNHGVDEHVWTSPKNAILIVEELTKTLCDLDPDNREYYEDNAAGYISELEKLDKAFTDLMENSELDMIVVGDRFPLRYFADAYKLNYSAAFSGCSTQGDASPKTITFLIDKINENNLPVVFHIELSNQKIAETIADETGTDLLLFHSAHNLSLEEFEEGLTYLEIMKDNLANLKIALNYKGNSTK